MKDTQLNDYSLSFEIENKVLKSYKGNETEIVVPNGIISIDASAFRDTNIKSITIPNSVLTIDACAFSGCQDLVSVDIPNSVTSINKSAFEFCTSLKSIIIPNGITSIAEGLFGNCESLISVSIPNSVTSIGDFAFYGCELLTDITIPNNVTHIGESAFTSCGSMKNIFVSAGNRHYASKDGVLYSKDGKTLIACPGGRAGNLVIPNGVTSIGDWAFAFCFMLESIAIPSSVLYIGDNVFNCCERLKNISVAKENENYTSYDGVLYTKDGKTLVSYPYGKGKTFIIPSNVSCLGDNAFSGCEIENIKIPDSVTEIGNSTFWACTNLKSIEIPNSVTKIGDWAFYNCNGLTRVVLHNGIESIGYLAFTSESMKTIFCRSNKQPLHWDEYWCARYINVVWNYKD